MSNWERNTIILLIGSLLGATFYFGIIIWQSIAAGGLVMPVLWVWLGYIIFQLAVSVGGAIFTRPGDAKDRDTVEAKGDERDQIIRVRSEAMQGHIGSAAVIVSLALWFWHQNPALLFHSIVAAMLIGEVGRGVYQLVSYNRAI